ncbi:zf-TFIIB domain-containing protein [Anaeromyxobacter oryzisoli]|jgi:Zn-finger nucleic acid-binding protein|uniref:zf-TFIIB domain-containing protein n=1 Tax=Anaeromyxobacter oryzisoli TaxID=2925408 RepID=UPI001F55E1B9|nr:zf-TFIIB domain-containing protein [Anaeromyxobacter sp. SG63]
MDCPRCSVEMQEITHEDSTLQRCPECGGIWVVDPADLNKMLLHANLPALSTIGGFVNVDEISGMCPACNVDLVVVEGGEKRSLAYDTCESCGGVWIDGDEDEPAAELDWDRANAQVVDFFKRFSKKK